MTCDALGTILDRTSRREGRPCTRRVGGLRGYSCHEIYIQDRLCSLHSSKPSLATLRSYKGWTDGPGFYF